MVMDDKKKLMLKTSLWTLVILIICWGLGHIIFRTKTKSPPPPEVVVERPKTMSITNYVHQTGNMVAYNSVNLVARVEGYLTAINFIDGTFIEKNKLLFVIEPEPYLDKLKEAKANVIVQKASHQYTQAEYERQKRMFAQNATSKNNVEKWEAQAEQTKAEIDKAVANEEIAAINYSYTHIHAPSQVELVDI